VGYGKRWYRTGILEQDAKDFRGISKTIMKVPSCSEIPVWEGAYNSAIQASVFSFLAIASSPPESSYRDTGGGG
jgi:hypothetical protein